MSERPETDELLCRVATGDDRAASELLSRHRQRLRRMVAIHLDDRVSARVDPSDVVQDTFVEAVRRLPDFSRTKPIPFYPWLRRLAWEKVVALHRHHIQHQKRSVSREEPHEVFLSGESQDLLADRLVQSQTSVSGTAMRQEMKEKVRSALSRLAPNHREILVLLFLERLSTSEAAVVLDISQDAVRSRQLRALEQFGKLARSLAEGSGR